MNKLNTEKIPQYIRRIYFNMSTSYLDQGLTKNQLLIQKTLSSIPDQELRKEILQKFKTLEKVTYKDYLTFIEIQLSTKTTSSGAINMHNGNKYPPRKQAPRPPKTDHPALCTNCNSDRPNKHLKEHCKAIKCSNTWCGKFFHQASFIQ